eukprot:scaffold20352_cov102-Isochrysis_galbana.AAC.3
MIPPPPPPGSSHSSGFLYICARPPFPPPSIARLQPSPPPSPFLCRVACRVVRVSCLASVGQPGGWHSSSASTAHAAAFPPPDPSLHHCRADAACTRSGRSAWTGALCAA